jgi:hypothetical protein
VNFRHGPARRNWRWPAAASAAAVVIAAGLTAWLLTRPAGERSRSSRAVPTTASTTAPPPRSTPSATTTTAAAPLPARPAPTGQQLGANVNLLFNAQDLSVAQVADQLSALHATGATLARSDALWEASEPDPPVAGTHHYDWSFDDEIATELASHGLSWLPILDYSAPWAQSIPGQDHSPPRSDADYAAYAQAFAARYGTGGGFWRAHPGLPDDPVTTFEIWNEPDNDEFWTPHPDAAAYASLYLAARGAIDTIDPSARVIIGGLTNPTAFLPALLAAQPQLRGHVDGVAIHPYGTPVALRDRIVNARQTLRTLGMAGTPLYVTEFGWTTSPPGALDYVPATTRPGDISSALASLRSLDCGVVAGLIYTWYSPDGNPADSQDWYGIDGVDGQPTADTRAFAAALGPAARDGPPRAACTP